MYFSLLAILVIISTTISIITKNRLFVLINGGVLSVLVYVIDEKFWVLSLILLAVTYIMEYIIYKRAN